MRSLLYFILLLTCACSTDRPKTTDDVVNIIEIEPNRRTHLTKQNLLHLLKVYDLGPIIFTKVVHIQTMVIPKSHPILTLNTRHMGSPNKLLSVFIHEQLHWWAVKRTKDFNQAVRDIQKFYPDLPIDSNQNSKYVHLLICYLEYKILEFYIGESDAEKVISQLIEDDKLYPWIYGEVLKNENNFKAIIKKYNLSPITLI